MGVFEQFPYTNFHDLNLDWILKKMKDLDKEVTEYIKNNKIQFADPIIWNIKSQYPANTLVTDPENNIVYLSTQAVPEGVALSNDDYWQAVFTLQALWDALDDTMESIAPINQGSTAQALQQMEVNELFWMQHKLYIVTSQILRGEQIGNNNSRTVTIEEMLLQAQAFLTQKINKNADDIEDLQQHNRYQDERISNIVSQAGTDNTEIVDGRIGAESLGGTTFSTIGDAIRDQITELYNNGIIHKSLTFTDCNDAPIGFTFIPTDILSSVKNIPPVTSGIMLCTFRRIPEPGTIQIAINYSGSANYRTLWIRASSSSSYSDWLQISTWLQRSGNIDADSLTGDHVYYINATNTLTNFPPIQNGDGLFISTDNNSGTWRQYFIQRDHSAWSRYMTSRDPLTFTNWNLIFDGDNTLINRVYSSNSNNNADNLNNEWIYIPTDKLSQWNNLPATTGGIILIDLAATEGHMQIAINYSPSLDKNIYLRSRGASGAFGAWDLINGITTVDTNFDLNSLTGVINSLTGWTTGKTINNTPFPNTAGEVFNWKSPNGTQQIFTGWAKDKSYPIAARNYYSGSYGDWDIINDRPHFIHDGFTCIVDSLGSGWVQDETGTNSGQFYQQSWPKYLADKLGCTFYISGRGGMSTANWLNPDDAAGISQFNRLPATPVYFIGLGANDVNQSVAQNDYISNYKKIIAEIKTKNANAIIFCCATGRDNKYLTYDEAMQNMINTDYTWADDNVMVFSIRDQIKAAEINSQLVGTHYTAYGYRLIAEATETKLREIMQNNPQKFGYSFSIQCSKSLNTVGYPNCY